MKIVVTGATGNIGSKLAAQLLDSGADLTLIARNPEKVKALAARGARVVAGEHVEAPILEQAVQGADTLFWLTPPTLTLQDPFAEVRRFADQAAEVIRRHPDLFVVHISSVGADRPDGTGTIAGLHAAEERFRAVGRNITSLRPNYFMENVLGSLRTIISDGAIYSVIPGETPVPQVATPDIAKFAAEILLAPKPGQHIVDIVGPGDITFDEVAAQLSAETGKPIRHLKVPGEALKQGLVQAGISLGAAELIVEMGEAIARGLAQEFRGEQKLTGSTTFAQFAHDVFLPAYRVKNQVARAS